MRTARTRRFRIGAAIASLIMLIGACTTSDDDDDATPVETDEPDETPTDPDPDPDNGDGPDAPAAENGPGVSDDEIAIGVSYLDFEALRAGGLSIAGWGDFELAFETFIDELNGRGGINGRSVTAVYAPFNPVGTESAEAACLALTEDNTVFAVLGGFLGPAEEANTCIAGRQETVLIGGGQTKERLAQAKAPWVQANAVRERAVGALLDLLDASGEVEGRRIGVVTGREAEDQQDVVGDKLESLGYEAAIELFNDAPSGDLVAEDTAWATIADRLRDAEVDTVVLVGSTTGAIRNIDSQGLDVDIWTADPEQLSALGASIDPEIARGTVTASALSDQELWEHETTAECRSIYAAANPDVEVKDPKDLEEGEESVFESITFACRLIQFFEILATDAGDVLNNQTFAKAIDNASDFALPGQPFNSLSADKLDANDSFVLGDFDPDVGNDGTIVPRGELQDVTP